MSDLEGVIKRVHIEGGTNKPTKETVVYYNKELEKKIEERRKLDKEIHDLMSQTHQVE